MRRLARLRAAIRLVRVALHLVRGLATVWAVYPLVSPGARLRLKRCWSLRLLSCLGVRPTNEGHVLSGGLLVANHISWLDVFVINAICPVAFVCKDEVRDWPLIGWLCSRTGTIFITRGSSRHAATVGDAVAGVLVAGGSVAVFPEGTTSDGESLLPVRSAMFQPAVDVGALVQPLLIRYRDQAGRISPAPVYVGDTGLFESLWRIASAARIDVTVRILPSIDPARMGRRDLAGQVETGLWEALQRANAAGASGLPSTRSDAAPPVGQLVADTT